MSIGLPINRDIDLLYRFSFCFVADVEVEDVDVDVDVVDVHYFSPYYILSLEPLTSDCTRSGSIFSRATNGA